MKIVPETLIYGGTVVLESGVEEKDILIGPDGTITEIFPSGTAPVRFCGNKVSAQGKVVLPGGVDAHVHLQGDIGDGIVTADDFNSGTRSAICGGTTTIFDFCEPLPGEKPAACIRRKKKQAEDACCDYAFHFAFTEAYEHELNSLDSVLDEGITSFKVYTCYPNTSLDYDQIRTVVEKVGNIGCVMVHAEDLGILREKARLKQNADDHAISHAFRRPIEAEITAVGQIALDLPFAKKGLMIAHTSTAGTMEIKHGLLDKGKRLLLETCPHYLEFSQDCLRGRDGRRFIMSPPLRTALDQEALWRGIFDGSVDILSTDHCPFLLSVKNAAPRIEDVPNGVGGVGQRLEWLYTRGIAQRGLSWVRFAELTATNPAKLFGIYPRKGAIRTGADADVLLLDPNRQWSIGSEAGNGKEDYSIYDTMQFCGKITDVFLRGNHVVKDGRYWEKGNYGTYIAQK